MNDKQQIEEILIKLKHGEFCQKECYGCCGDNNIDITCKTVVTNLKKELLKHYQPKTIENAVVLSREEHEWLTCCFGKFEKIMNDIKKQERKETAREIITKIGEHLKRYAHIHKYAKEARKSTEEYADGTPVEMESVWDMITLNKNGYADYETVNELQDNIENIALSRLLQEFEKDFRLFAKQYGVEVE